MLYETGAVVRGVLVRYSLSTVLGGGGGAGLITKSLYPFSCRFR